jgi:hypothetical protein
MARLLHGLNSPIIGKLGTAVGASWKGRYYLRSLPSPRLKTRTKKPGEAQNQNKFSDMHHWLKPVLKFVREGFKGYSETVEGFNAAKSYNLRNAFTMIDGSYKPDPSLVLVSYGNYPTADNISCTLQGKEVHFSWDTTVTPDTNEFDQAMLLAYCPESKLTQLNTTGEFRKTGNAILKLFQPGEYHVYLAFRAHDRSRQSNSVYLGVVTYTK